MVLGSSPVAVTSPSDFAPASSKEFLDIQATIECGFTLKHVRDMTRTYSVNIYIAYELAASSSHTSDPTIKNCLFGAVTLTENGNIEKYKYSVWI